MKKLKKLKRHVAKLMVAVMISTLLSSVFSSVAYANEITELTSETNEGSEENGITEEGQTEDAQDGDEILSEINEGDAENEEDSEMENDSVAEEVEDSETEDSETEDSENEDSENEDSETKDSETEDSETEDSEKEDSEKEDISEEKSENEEGSEQESDSEIGKKENNKKGAVKGTRSLNGWVEDGDYTYFYRNGEAVSSEIIEYEGDLYAIDWQGHLYKDTGFYFTGYDFYRAKPDGKLCVNEWSEDKWGRRAYHGPDGIGYHDGLFEIDGNYYYFGWNSYLVTNATANVDGIEYIIGSDGVAQPMANYSGWHQSGGYEYYYKNGKLVTNCVKKISGNYYAFDSEGRKVVNGCAYISVNGDSTDTEDCDVYYADENGILCANLWVYNRYFGADRKAYKNGVYQIDGVNYYFTKESVLGYWGAISIDGKNYVVDWNGKATELIGNGWHEVNRRKYYILNGNFLNNRKKKIGENYYFFDDRSVMIDDEIGYYYGADGNWVAIYGAKPGGSLYINEWKNNTDTWYYFGADGAAYTGLQTINGQQYYFSEYGHLSRNESVNINGKKYISDNSGVLHEVLKEGWQEIDGHKYYVENGEFVKSCIKKIGNDYYAFSSQGRVFVDQRIIVDCYDYQIYGNEKAIYFAGEDGKLLRNTWKLFNDDNLYYLGEDGKAYRNGIYQIDGKRYYFSSSGTRIHNTLFRIDNILYLADDTGVVYEADNNSWVQTGIGMYYIYNGYMLRNTVFTINGVQYAFNHTGTLLTNGFIDKNKKTYITDENGVASLAEEGWLIKGDDAYYIRNGQMLRSAIININGEAVAFGADGKWIKGNGFNIGRFSATSNDFDPYEHDSTTSGNSTDPYENYSVDLNTYQRINTGNSEMPYSVSSNAYNPYMADKDGKVLRNTWFHDDIDDFWCYFDETCRKVAGWKVLDGKTYYMDKLGVRQSGWQTIKGKKYNFKENGVLRTNCLVTGEDGNKYYVNSKGVMQKDKIVTVGDKKYYVDAEGIVKTSSLVTVGDKKYYVDSKGVVKTDSLVTVGNKKYYVDSKGVVKTSSLVTVGDKKYYVDSKGVVKTDSWVTVSKKKYYVDKKGVVKTDCFVTADGKKYHVNSKGVMQTGWQKIDKKWYYFNPKTGVMVTGTKKIDGKTYKFNSKGVCTNKK